MKASGAKLAPILAAFLLQQAGAQQIGTPDMAFQINFIPVDGTASNFDLGGECNYNKFIRIPNFIPNAPTFTDDLEVHISLPLVPDAVRLFEMKKGGSLKEMAELTNYIAGGDDIYLDQHLRLKKKQIHSLIEGDFYVEVDFGDNKYIGNLTPQYQFANGPTPVLNLLSPVFLEITVETQRGKSQDDWVIAADNHNANVFISGTKSEDPFYLPMTYSWGIYDNETLVETNKGPALMRSFGLGHHSVVLNASDAIANGTPVGIALWVFTPGQAISNIMPWVGFMRIPPAEVKDLTRLLANASKYFDQGKMLCGCKELRTFIRRVENLRSNDPNAPWIVERCQKILESFRWETSIEIRRPAK